MLEQMALWDEPIRDRLWQQLPPSAQDEVVALLARLALEAVRTRNNGTEQYDGTNTRRDER